MEPDNHLPYNEYYEYFGPDYTLHVEPCSMENLNVARDLERIRLMHDELYLSTYTFLALWFLLE